jgi:CBS domain-containing protein
MVPLPGRLGSLTAHDVMTEKLVVLSETDTIAYAAMLFKEQRISGAPVVNEAGKAVGVLSVSDILPSVTNRLREAVEPGRPQSRQAEWEEICELLGTPVTGGSDNDLVGERMSRRLVSVREQTPLIEVARIMCEGHWHRVTVVDSEGRLRGIVSTMDVLAALVQTADEYASPE